MRYVETSAADDNIRFDYNYSNVESYFRFKNWFVLLVNERANQSITIGAPRFVNKKLLLRLRKEEE
jgi:hypothetical protein